jgi:hypothetical protein
MLEGFLLAAQDDKPLCMPIHQIEEVLAGYREKAWVAGRVDSGNMLVIYTSPNGTWTAVVIAPNGMACVGPMGRDMKLVGTGA